MSVSALRFLLLRAFLSYLVFSYGYLAWLPMVIYDCVEVGQSQRMRDFLIVTCYAGDWFRYLFGSIFAMICFVIGVPLGLLWILRRYAWGAHPDAALLLGSQITSYREHYRWWELATCVWKLALVLSLHFPSSKVAKVVLFIILLLIRMGAQFFLRPFAQSLDNREELWLAAPTMLVVFCGLLFYVSRPAPASAGYWTLYILVVLSISVVGITILVFTVQTYRQLRADDGKNTGSFTNEVDGGDEASFADGEMMDLHDSVVNYHLLEANASPSEMDNHNKGEAGSVAT